MAYTKQESHSYRVQVYYDGVGFCPGSGSNQSWTDGLTINWVNTKSGEANPNRRKQIARGENATTNYTHSKKEVAIPGITCTVFWTAYDLYCGGWARGSETLSGWDASVLRNDVLYDPSTLSLDAADNLARQNAFKAIRARQTAFQGGTWVGELAETLRMIRGRSKDLFRGVTDYATDAKKRRRGQSIADRLRRASDLWLERAYGWGPLLNDVRSGNKWLEQRFNQFEPTYPFKGTGKDESNVSTNGYGYFNDRLQVEYVKNSVTRSSVTYYGRVDGGVNGGRLLFESRLLGFDPSNWIPTVYNLIPYSFLVDYFSNLGDVISSWSTCTSGVRWVARSDFRQHVIHVTDWKISDAGQRAAMGGAYSLFNPVSHVSSDGKNRVARTLIGRHKEVVLEPPRLTFEIPGLSLKWLNMTALATSRYLGR